jgi:hypothetical protein
MMVPVFSGSMSMNSFRLGLLRGCLNAINALTLSTGKP